MANKLFNSEENYGVITKLLHWVVALLIIGMLVLGFTMEDFKGLEKLRYYGIHKSTGIIVLGLVVLRFIWRQVNHQPAIPESKGKVSPSVFKLMEFAAKTSHAMLYLLMFAMPFSGWVMSSAYGFPVSVFGWFTMPNLISPDKEIAEFLSEAHEIMAFGIIALVAAHIFAALFHHFYLKDVVMKRMLPALLIAVFAAAPAFAAAPELKVDKTKSSLKFEAVQNGAPAVGEFKNFETKLSFDPKNLAESKVMVEVDMASVSSTYAEMADTLKAADFFDIAKFPKAKFESTGFTNVEGDKYKSNGKLTIRDKTNDAVIEFTLKKYDATQAIAEGGITINRNAFGVGQGEWKDTGAIKDPVKITFLITANK